MTRNDMPAMPLSVHWNPATSGVHIRRQDGSQVGVVLLPVHAYDRVGEVVKRPYHTVDQRSSESMVGRGEWTHGGVSLRLEDEWASTRDGVLLTRRLRSSEAAQEVGAGVQLALTIGLGVARDGRRFFAPGMVYASDQHTIGTFSYCDARLAYPVVAVHAPGEVTALRRDSTAAFDTAPRRVAGQTRFLQRTDIGSVGFRTAHNSDALVAAWPYFEGDASAMLDQAGSPVAALYPLDVPIDVTISYRFTVASAATFNDAVRSVFRHVLEHADPEPSKAAVSPEESIRLRLASATQTYAVSGSGFAGFLLNFDPELGYDAEAKAFGASFAEHGMTGSHNILEYGFTGRQLNLAYCLAREFPDTWLDRGEAVVDSFVSRMATESGWVHTLWDFAAERPLFACGDPRGTVMHYLGQSDVPGTYTRMMTEAGHDLLLNIELHERHERSTRAWWAAAVALGDFFVRHQNSDGSWYRAYAPDGTPIVDTDWFGYRASSAKTATAAVVPFLLELAKLRGSDGLAYLEAAGRAGEFALQAFVADDDYRGGTLDNPNLVDKEAAFLLMRAFLGLQEAAVTSCHRGPEEWLEGASRAATVAVTWHSLWNVPLLPDTPLGSAGVRSVGWGGINSVWGVGVTDIYSLFFIADLHRLGLIVDEPIFTRVAELVAWSSLEGLAVPGDMKGLADTGMQPEGISFCSQGADEGLISKGDRWGGLGWPYTAGTYGMSTYLDQRETSR